jgi:uncharacterized protein DUF6307
MTEIDFVSRYEQRIRFVQQTVRQHTKLSDKASRELAVRVVDALDHIPEVR